MNIVEEPMVPSQPADGHTSATLSLTGLYDLLDVLDAEINGLPGPAPLFANELRRSLADSLGVAGNDR